MIMDIPTKCFDTNYIKNEVKVNIISINYNHPSVDRELVIPSGDVVRRI
jgi:hypothetical protein